MHDRRPSQIKQVLPLAPVAGAITLPVADMRQTVLNGHSFAQLRAPLRRQLPFAQLLQQPLIGVDADTAAMCARRTPFAQRTAGTAVCGKMHTAPGSNGSTTSLGQRIS